MSPKRSRNVCLFAIVFMAAAAALIAHPLGNFSINQFVRLENAAGHVRVRYVIDMAEIPTFQESSIIDMNGDGASSEAELDAYLKQLAPRLADNLVIAFDGERVLLRVVAKSISLPVGSGGLPTMRIVCDLEGDMPNAAAGSSRRARLEVKNYSERVGWREIVIVPSSGVTVFDSTAFGSAVTDELKEYPQDRLAAPLDERAAEWSFTMGDLPTSATQLRTREGLPVERAARDRFAELIAVPQLTPSVALLALLLAAGLGALHAFSPGHGKTVVGAYLVGSKGTVKHAAFLGLTVTVTHTAGVFALGLVTLFASRYVLPERLFPILSFISGAIVLIIGVSLFVRRLRAAFFGEALGHTHGPGNEDHTHEHSVVHSHGGSAHSHMPPDADGASVSWRSLLALGVSGGLLPCPSALVVMLAAISLGRVGYGLALVVAFSVGLATTLTAIGLLFVYAGRLIKGPAGNGWLVRLLPALSALVIACVGAAICSEALGQVGLHVTALRDSFGKSYGVGDSLTSMSAAAVLGLGLIFGLKHATEADHIVAVSTIVSEHRNVLRAALVGGLWGVGHTASLLVVGVVVLLLRVAVPLLAAAWLEFGVALMIVGLGVNVIVRALRRQNVHGHLHEHDGLKHAHVHFHDREMEPPSHSHAVARVGLKPVLVGAMHGLAGSAALTLLVLTQIESFGLGLLYLMVFGIGSVFGMLLMSSLVGLPFALSAGRLPRLSHGLQLIAGVLSVAFGLWYAFGTGRPWH
ncbi:MAG: sulfite exporter TauE/SafE family protein [Pyrinomonadaceae bacterium]|nr:sulfite exporter TauE/SafE family protein [Pyrinomonadaceae bacterium]